MSDQTYNHATVEDQVQSYWEEHGTFEVTENSDKPKFYCLDMFPYPSGAGLHVGHPEGYTATDILCRYKRMKGFNVLHPMGWDAFGLPAEQYAIATGVHPEETTRKAIDTFRRQLKRFGFSYDWSREFATTDPAYYRFTQWIWLEAYRSWFDPKLGRARPIAELETVLAACAPEPLPEPLPLFFFGPVLPVFLGFPFLPDFFGFPFFRPFADFGAEFLVGLGLGVRFRELVTFLLSFLNC